MHISIVGRNKNICYYLYILRFKDRILHFRYKTCGKFRGILIFTTNILQLKR